MNKYPLIKFVAVFISGIVLQSVIRINLTYLVIIFLVFILLTVLLHFLYRKQTNKWTGFIILLALLSSGMVHYALNKSEKVKYPFDLPVIKDAYLFGKVVDVNLMRPDRIIFYLSVDSIQSAEKHFKGKIQLLSTVKDSTHNLDGFYQKIAIGNYVKAKGTITRARDNRNPGEFDYESTLTEAGINGLLVIYRVSDIKIISDRIDYQKNAAFNLRKSIDEVIRKYHNSSTASLLRGLLLADKSMINFETKVDFINAGVIHVLAVSGLHVGFIVLIFVFLFKRLNPYYRYGFTIIGLLLFVVITNYPTSVLRAAIMAIAMVIAPLTGRSYNSMNSLALAALIILLLNPGDLFNPGFLLSFSAVIAIVTLYPPMARYISRWKIKSGIVKYLLLFFSVSFAAQIGTLPFTLLYFHKLSLVALIANLIVIPLIGFIVGLGIMTLIAGSVFYFLGISYASANEFLSFLLFSFVRLMGRYEYAFISIQKFSLFDSVLFYSAAFLIALFWKRLTNWKSKLIFSLLTVSILFTGFKIDDEDLMPDNKLSVLAVDVGQGDAILIKFPYGKTALIDGGNATQFFDNGERILIPLLDYLGIDKIDYGFITHADADHYKGYLALIEKKRVKQIFKPTPDFNVDSDNELENAIRSNNIPVKYFGKSFLKIDGVRLYILNDTTNYIFSTFSMNDRSGVLKLVFGNISFLFTGDSGIKAEKYFLNNYGSFLKSNVLKAGHHGSKTSSSENFIDTVEPEYVVISAGVVNFFNHPSPEIIDRFNSKGIKILRTDHSGGILLQSDGCTIKNINWKKE